MKGHVINLDGQLVCIFPFTDATEFESLAHNDLPSYGLDYRAGEPDRPDRLDKGNLPNAGTGAGGNYGWCFISTLSTTVERFGQCFIMERDRDALAALALENDAWAAEQVKETDSVAEAELRSEEQLAEMMYNDEGPEREFNVTTVENWKMVVKYSLMATSKQDAMDRIGNQEVDFYDKELIEEDITEWKSVEEA